MSVIHSISLFQVVTIDIANDTVLTNDYKDDEDPTKYKSVKTGRGPLIGPWQVTSLFIPRQSLVVEIWV